MTRMQFVWDTHFQTKPAPKTKTDTITTAEFDDDEKSWQTDDDDGNGVSPISFYLLLLLRLWYYFTMNKDEAFIIIINFCFRYYHEQIYLLSYFSRLVVVFLFWFSIWMLLDDDRLVLVTIQSIWLVAVCEK